MDHLADVEIDLRMPLTSLTDFHLAINFFKFLRLVRCLSGGNFRVDSWVIGLSSLCRSKFFRDSTAETY